MSILDLDKEGSLNLDADSDDNNTGRARINLEGDLGEHVEGEKSVLVNKQSENEFERSESAMQPDAEEAGPIQSAQSFQLEDDQEEDD